MSVTLRNLLPTTTTTILFSLKEAGGDIPVKEIMDLMQADPAFDVLFSFFGLGKQDFSGTFSAFFHNFHEPIDDDHGTNLTWFL